MISSMLGYNIGTFTQRFRGFFYISECVHAVLPDTSIPPINPNPALLTALASLCPLTQIIPAWMMGYFILKVL
jgi:hypothetical protein